jgi:hypothetical protein
MKIGLDTGQIIEAAAGGIIIFILIRAFYLEYIKNDF